MSRDAFGDLRPYTTTDIYKEESTMADKGSNADNIVKSVLQIAIDILRNSKKNKTTWGDLAGNGKKK